jgi:hypothetical protein
MSAMLVSGSAGKTFSFLVVSACFTSCSAVLSLGFVQPARMPSRIALGEACYAWDEQRSLYGLHRGRLSGNSRWQGSRGSRHGLQGLSCSDDGEDIDKSKQTSGRWRGIAAAFAAALLLGTSTLTTTGALFPPSLVDTVTRQTQPASAFVEASDRKLEPSEKNTIRLFRENTPSVVFINTFVERQDRFSLDLQKVCSFCSHVPELHQPPVPCIRQA